MRERVRRDFWAEVAASGHSLPPGERLADLTAELTRLLGDPDPSVREDIAVRTLRAWLTAGVYDGLLAGLGDGMAAGLEVGLGAALGGSGSDDVLRRAASAEVLGACIARESEADVVGAARLWAWGDRLLGWFVAERDLRGHVPGKGPALALVRGAEALRALVEAPTMTAGEHAAVLEVVALRVARDAGLPWVDGEADHLAAVVLAVVRRGSGRTVDVEGWVDGIARTARPATAARRRTAAQRQAEQVLRALHLGLALDPDLGPDRADLLLAVLDHLRRLAPPTLRGG